MTAKKRVHIYTDGACSCNPGPGGWGTILIYGDVKKELSGNEVETTNNRMELMAAIEGLKSLKMPCIVELYTDSAYLHNAFQNGWIWNWKKNNWKKSDKTSVANVDLWQELIQLNSIHEIHWHKVKGHSDNELNNRCDELARNAIEAVRKEHPCDDEYKLYMDVAYSSGFGAICTYLVHDNALIKNTESGSMPRYRLELRAMIKALSSIRQSSIVGVYLTNTVLSDVLIDKDFTNKSGIDKGITKDFKRLSELAMSHDLRLHKSEDSKRDANMIACQEEARAEMTRIIREKAEKAGKKFVKLYISGAANNTMGAWCALCVSNGIVREYTNTEFGATQNLMRLQAIINTLESIDSDCIIEINTDSMYIYETATSWLDRWRDNGWKKANSKEAAHADLWKIISDLSYEIYWRKHEKNSDDKFLIRCNSTANELLYK